MRYEPRICFRERQNKVEAFLKLLYQEIFLVMLYCHKNFRELDPKPSLTEAVIEMFLENSCTLYDTQNIPLNIVLWRSSQAQNVQAAHQRNFGKVWQAKQIKSTQVYDKSYQKIKKLNFVASWPHALGPYSMG